jgi:DNA-directed RNA polymerase II subunit RPB4
MKESFHDVFEKSLVYVNRFSKFDNKETLKKIKSFLKEKNLHEFEIASFSNLLPPTVEEAKG